MEPDTSDRSFQSLCAAFLGGAGSATPVGGASPHGPGADRELLGYLQEGDARADAASTEPIVGGYRLLAPMGAGGTALVFLAYEESSGAERVLKWLRPPAQLAARGSDSAYLATRFRREARVEAYTGSHDNLMLAIGSGEAEARPYLVFPRHDGVRSLESLLESLLGAEEGERPSDRVWLQILIGVARALMHLHDRGLVHRDVKPANVLVAPDAGGDRAPVRAWLCDFGLVKIPGEADPSPFGRTAGTPGFVAPEVTEQGLAIAGPPADVYAFGHLMRAVSRELRAPAVLEPWIERCTAHDPGRRPPLSEVAAALEKRVRPDRRRRRLAMVASMLGLVAIGSWARATWPASRTAEAATPVAAQASFFLAGGGGEGEQSEDELLGPESVVQLQSQLYLVLELEEPLYVYLFSQDDEGRRYCLEPVPGRSTHLEPGRHRLPSDDEFWVVDTPASQENLLLILSRERNPVAESLAAVVPTAALGDSASHGRDDPEAGDIALRGIGGRTGQDRTGGAVTGGDAGPLDEIISWLEEEEREGGGVFYRHWTFEHGR